jgi:hypothetical protein
MLEDADGVPNTDFPGTVREAKALALAACEVLLGAAYFNTRLDAPDRPWQHESQSISAWHSTQPWSQWFVGYVPSWDHTWVVLDERRGRIWLLCVTDQD